MKQLRELLFPLIAVIAAFVVGGILILLVGDNPITVYRIVIGSALTYPVGIGWTLYSATPLIFTGLAVALAFRCGLLNIGAEGQLYMGAFAAAWVGIKLGGVTFTPLSGIPSTPIANLPSYMLIPLACLAAIVAGAVWAGIPGLLKARFGSHEVINTIMMNFIAIAILGYLTQYHFKNKGGAIMETTEIGANAHVAHLGTFVPGMPEFIPVNLAFIFAIVAGILVYILLWKTKWGYEIRVTGLSPTAAEYGGISPRKQIVIAMAISGALAGMVGIHEVLGSRHTFLDSFSGNWGFTGIAVALLGRNHPVGVVIAAIFFGALDRGGIYADAFSEKVSKDIVDILKGLVILFVAGEAMFRYVLPKFNGGKEK